MVPHSTLTSTTQEFPHHTTENHSLLLTTGMKQALGIAVLIFFYAISKMFVHHLLQKPKPAV